MDAKISRHFKDGQPAGWKKFIMGRNFHLGSDQVYARRLAAALQARSELLKLAGEGWTDEVILECKKIAAGVVEHVMEAAVQPPQSFGSPSKAPSCPPPVTSSPMFTITALPVVSQQAATPGPLLYDVMHLFCEAQHLRATTGLITHAHAVYSGETVEKFKRCFQNVPINEIGVNEISQAVGYWCSRPPSRRNGANGAPISVSTVTTYLTLMSQFFDWCDFQGHWMPPRRWQECFYVKAHKLYTRRETKRRAEGFPNFAVDELQLVWCNSSWSPSRLMYLGLGLFCAFTQKEISTLLTEDIHVDADGQMRIKRCRNKTGVFGSWWVPPEVAKVVKEDMEYTRQFPNPEGVAFVTATGGPLVPESGRGDTVARTWGRMIADAAPIAPKYSFKYLRKTILQQVRDIGGVEMAQLMAAHKFKQMVDTNYTRGSFLKLELLVRDQIYPRWKTVFEKPDAAVVKAKYHQIKAAQQLEAAQQLNQVA